MGFDTYINAPESVLAKVTYYLTYKKFSQLYTLLYQQFCIIKVLLNV